MYDYSIVIPVYNEAEIIGDFYAALLKVITIIPAGALK